MTLFLTLIKQVYLPKEKCQNIYKKEQTKIYINEGL